ncbi:NLI interacting factor-like phosphatase [Senna tora]|uniref:NLI interacting factor-like phosphatase n=1 Tax=Senna tora TaxID=362788 RepID=A0A834TB61_9FABA|nr:NLI interacting factor-like phosphatase [Senna tora]
MEMEGSSNNVNLIASGSESDPKECDSHGNDLCLPLEKMSLVPKKKLLVLSLNGLLLRKIHRDDLQEIPKNRRIDGRHRKFLCPSPKISSSSALKDFKWQSGLRHSNSGFKSLEKNSKPLFFKELKQVWKRISLGGPYSEANTLLVDTKPYSALLNPPNTAIFPEPYDNEADENDAGLDPKGALGLYLRGLADAKDVQSYVKEHSFGQSPITSSHPNWDYYSVVLRVRDISQTKNATQAAI